MIKIFFSSIMFSCMLFSLLFASSSASVNSLSSPYYSPTKNTYSPARNYSSSSSFSTMSQQVQSQINQYNQSNYHSSVNRSTHYQPTSSQPRYKTKNRSGRK